MSQYNWELVCCYCVDKRWWHFKMTIFLIRGQLMRRPLIEFFHLSNLIQMSNDHRIVDTDFFGNFLCSFKRTSFDDPLSWLLSTSNDWPLCSSSSKLSSPLQNFLNHHCTFPLLAVPGPNVLLMLQVVSAVLWHILNLDKKIAQICFLPNIISLVWNTYKINGK